MIIYGLKNCDTCRKARKSLPQAQFIDLKEQPLPQDLMQAALAQFGAALVNTRSTTWRGLDEQDRARPAEDVLREHPALMKRPLIAQPDGVMHLGWTAQVKSALGVAE